MKNFVKFFFALMAFFCINFLFTENTLALDLSSYDLVDVTAQNGATALITNGSSSTWETAVFSSSSARVEFTAMSSFRYNSFNRGFRSYYTGFFTGIDVDTSDIIEISFGFSWRLAFDDTTLGLIYQNLYSSSINIPSFSGFQYIDQDFYCSDLSELFGAYDSSSNYFDFDVIGSASSTRQCYFHLYFYPTSSITAGSTHDTSQYLLYHLLSSDYAYSSSHTWTSVTWDFYTPSISVYRPHQSDADKEQSATEDAQQQGQDSADSASSDVDSATTTVVGELSSFVEGLGSVSGDSCVFDTSSLHDFVGVDSVDLCALDPPSEFSTITGLVLVVVVVPIWFWMLYTVIGMFVGWFGGGGQQSADKGG